MANLTRICLFFALLFLSHELLSTDGRTPRQSIQPPNAASTKVVRDVETFRSLEGDAEAFRPTNPGHSPGVGHSVNN